MRRRRETNGEDEKKIHMKEKTWHIGEESG